MDIVQMMIIVFGVTAVTLSQTPKYQRYACFFGLAGQPFWFLAAIDAKQWGVFVVCCLYTLAWCKGIYTFWFKKTPVIEPIERRTIQDVDVFPNPMWVMFVPVISTGHMTEEDNNDLGYLCLDPIGDREDLIMDMPEGFLIYIGDDEENWANYPDNVKRLCEWAHKANYEWLRLDQAGDKLPNFPVYDW